MARSVFVPALCAAIGAGAALLVTSWRAPTEPALSAPAGPDSPRVAAGAARDFGEAADAESHGDVGLRLKRLEARFSQEAAERKRLAEKLEAIVAQLAVRDGGSDTLGPARVTSNVPPAAVEAPQPAAASAIAADDPSTSAMERALAAAGLDAVTAADIKRRQDELMLTEIYLRDQATREQWLDTPRFTEEMAAIDAQRTPLRNEIGDDAYDRYLFAMGETNRVRVEDVMSQSPAAQAGVQTGDLIVRYGEARLFAPRELVAETRSGIAGETVRLAIIRNGAPLEVDVPRGPLGLRVAPTHGTPEAG